MKQHIYSGNRVIWLVEKKHEIIQKIHPDGHKHT